MTRQDPLGSSSAPSLRSDVCCGSIRPGFCNFSESRCHKRRNRESAPSAPTVGSPSALVAPLHRQLLVFDWCLLFLLLWRHLWSNPPCLSFAWPSPPPPAPCWFLHRASWTPDSRNCGGSMRWSCCWHHLCTHDFHFHTVMLEHETDPIPAVVGRPQSLPSRTQLAFVPPPTGDSS